MAYTHPRRGARRRNQRLRERERALEALALMRSDGMSLSAAARNVGTTPATARRHILPALEQQGRRYRANPSDRLPRDLRVLTEGGPLDVVASSSRGAQAVGRHWNAVHKYLVTGQTDQLRQFARTTVGGHPLLTDPDRIDELARRGQLDFETLYARRG